VSNSTIPTSQPYAVLPACVRSLSARTTVANDAHSDRNQVALFSSALHTLPLPAKLSPAMLAKACRAGHDWGIVLLPPCLRPPLSHNRHPNNARVPSYVIDWHAPADLVDLI